mmetsp:Transcript_36793/g.57004  ORF Transcript_36793/g.57004 Transcript_36793/m.57004 type:complete len:226 (-) Transcript_36793:176-853(-)
MRTTRKIAQHKIKFVSNSYLGEFLQLPFSISTRKRAKVGNKQRASTIDVIIARPIWSAATRPKAYSTTKIAPVVYSLTSKIKSTVALSSDSGMESSKVPNKFKINAPWATEVNQRLLTVDPLRNSLAFSRNRRGEAVLELSEDGDSLGFKDCPRETLILRSIISGLPCGESVGMPKARAFNSLCCFKYSMKPAENIPVKAATTHMPNIRAKKCVNFDGSAYSVTG